MLIYVLLGVLVTTQQGYARPSVTHGPIIGQTSYEFSSNKTFSFNARIEDVLFNAQAQNATLTLVQNCTAPAMFKYGKCDRLYFRHLEEQSNITVLFDTVGVDFLANETERACDGGWNSDGSILIMMSTQQPNRCKLVFKLTEEEVNFDDLTLVKTAFKNLNLYQFLGPKPGKNVLLYILLLIFVTLAMISSVFVCLCFGSDDLGDDEERIVEEHQNAANEIELGQINQTPAVEKKPEQEESADKE